MSYREVLSDNVVSLSASTGEDLCELGLSEEHLSEALSELSRQLLALGARLLYGGDLRRGGFTELLLELAARYRRDGDVGDARKAIINPLSWPTWVAMPRDDLRSHIDEVSGIAKTILLDKEGREVDLDANEPIQQPTDEDWKIGLTSMRGVIAEMSSAHIAIGGATQAFKGVMPGIAEEVLQMLEAHKPVYLLGGFGGCSRKLSAALGLIDGVNRNWPGSEKFERFNAESLENGLSEEENRILARTPHIDEAMILVLRGLIKSSSAR